MTIIGNSSDGLEIFQRSIIEHFTMDFLRKEEPYIKTLRSDTVHTFLNCLEHDLLSYCEDEEVRIWQEGIALTTLIEQSKLDLLPIDYPDIESYLTHTRYYHKPI